MIPIRRREDIIAIAQRHAPTNACAQVMGGMIGVTLLGSFTAVEGLPGWIVQVVSPHKRTWLIAVLIDEVDRKQTIRYLSSVPWGTWGGDSAGTNDLRDGDVPRLASFERMKAHASKIQADPRQ